MDDVLEIEMIRIPVNVIISRATSDEYLRHSRKHDFLKVRDIFEEIPSKYVNYSNIGGALCQLRDIRQSAESYRINLKEKKKRKKEKEETKIYLRIPLIIARRRSSRGTKPLMLYSIELSYQSGKRIVCIVGRD